MKNILKSRNFVLIIQEKKYRFSLQENRYWETVGQFQLLLSSTLNMVAKMLGLWNCICQHKVGDIKNFGIKYFLSLYIVRWSEDGNQLLKFKIIWSLQYVTGIIKWSPRSGRGKMEIINLWIWIEEIIEFKLYVKCIHHKIYPPFENSINLKKQKIPKRNFQFQQIHLPEYFYLTAWKALDRFSAFLLRSFPQWKMRKFLHKKNAYFYTSLLWILRIGKKSI